MQNSGGWGVSNIMEYSTKPENSLWSKYHLTADGIFPCSAFLVTSSLLKIEPPPTDTSKCLRLHLLKQFFCIISVVTATVMISHPPDRSLSSYPNKPHSEEKYCIVVLETVFLSPLSTHSCLDINGSILFVM